MNKPHSETIRSFFFWVTTLIMFVQSSNSGNGFRHESVLLELIKSILIQFVPGTKNPFELWTWHEIYVRNKKVVYSSIWYWPPPPLLVSFMVEPPWMAPWFSKGFRNKWSFAKKRVKMSVLRRNWQWIELFHPLRALKSPQKLRPPGCSSANFLGSWYISGLKSKSYYEILIFWLITSLKYIRNPKS